MGSVVVDDDDDDDDELAVLLTEFDDAIFPPMYLLLDIFVLDADMASNDEVEPFAVELYGDDVDE